MSAFILPIHTLGGDAVRVKSSDTCEVLACGCAHDKRSTWLQFCDVHWLDWSGLHEAARVAHLATLGVQS